MTMPNNVATRSKDAQCAVDRAAIIRTLMGGTQAMRKTGEVFLPREPAESKAAYDARIARSTLFNAVGKTVEDMTGKVFAKPVVLKDNVPETLKAYAEDIDLTGRHISIFAHDAFYDALQTGIGYILTDMPPALPQGSTLKDEQTAGIRPYLVYIPIERMLGWKSSTINGAEVLTQVRILESVSEPDGEFHEKETEQVKVLEPGRWRTFRKNDKDEWVLYAEGKNSLNKITLAPFYTNRTEFMLGSPRLAKLADLNVAHWQSASDQRNILHVARVPILFGAGFAEAESIVVGAASMTRTTNADAKLTYVEHSGAAIGSGREDLKDLEFQMQTMGLQLLIPQPGGKTATGEVRDDVKENSPLAMMARSLADALESSLGFMAEYEGLGKDAGGEVDVNKDFGIQAGAGTDLQILLDAVNSGQISKKTFWAEWQRRGVLSDSFDADKEKELIAGEAPEIDAGPGRGMNLDGPPADLANNGPAA